VRTKSQKILGMVETVLNLPVTLNRQPSREEAQGSLLPRALSRKGSTRMEEEGNEAKFNGEAISMEGKVKYEDLLQLLSCMGCEEMCVPPMTQCRKGHLYCQTCKACNRTCKVCKQTMVEAPNIALDKLLSFIALPCKFGSRGCPELLFLNQKCQHEALCRYRPVPCQNTDKGCTAVFSYKDICWHHKQCPYTTNNNSQTHKTEKQINTSSTPEKRKTPKPTTSLKAHIKEARERKCSKSPQIEIRIDSQEQTSGFKEVDKNNENHLECENIKTSETLTTEDVPQLPLRRKSSKK